MCTQSQLVTFAGDMGSNTNSTANRQHTKKQQAQDQQPPPHSDAPAAAASSLPPADAVPLPPAAWASSFLAASSPPEPGPIISAICEGRVHCVSFVCAVLWLFVLRTVQAASCAAGLYLQLLQVPKTRTQPTPLTSAARSSFEPSTLNTVSRRSEPALATTTWCSACAATCSCVCS